MQTPQTYTVVVHLDSGTSIVLDDAHNIGAFRLKYTMEDLLSVFMGPEDAVRGRQLLLEYDYLPRRAIMVDRSKIAYVEIKS